MIGKGFNKDRFFKLLSALQKSIRRRLTERAMIIGVELFKMSPAVLWSRLRVISNEDVESPLGIICVEALHNQDLDIRKDPKKQGDRMRLAMVAIKILSEDCTKDRRGDMMLHILQQAEEDSQVAREILESFGKLDDFKAHELGDHAGKGMNWEHFLSEGSKCENEVPESRAFRELWSKVLRKGQSNIEKYTDADILV